MSPSDIWERLLVDGLARDFQQMRLDFLRRLMRRKTGKDDPQGAVADWAERNDNAVRQFRAMISRAQAQPPIAPAVLAQIASQARNLLERSDAPLAPRGLTQRRICGNPPRHGE